MIKIKYLRTNAKMRQTYYNFSNKPNFAPKAATQGNVTDYSRSQ